MPITYRQHQDTRDGKIYNCVLMPDGKWWSAENLAWDSGYYKHEDAQSAIPNGCHGPTRGEWDLLNSASGGGQYLKSAGGWAGFNGLDTYGFALSPTGYVDGVLRSSDRSYHIVFPYIAGSFRGVYSADPYSYSVVYGTSGPDQAYFYAIRFIVDVFNEPENVPPTKIKGAFSGSGVRAFMSIKSLGGTLEITIASQTTSSLTIDPTFIETWGKQSGPVQIMVVDGEYISEWIDWEFK